MKNGELRKVVEEEQGKEGEHVLSLSGVKHNASGEKFPRSNIQCEVGSVIHELG